MIRSLFVSLFIMIAVSVFRSNKSDTIAEVKGVEKALTSGLKIVFDFGNNPVYSAWGGLKSKQKLVDEKGEEIPFNSMVDAGNYLSDKGWTFVPSLHFRIWFTSHCSLDFCKRSNKPRRSSKKAS